MVRHSRIVKPPPPILPSHFRLRPRKTWRFRVIGYCSHNTLIDYDDCMAIEFADNIAATLLSDGEKYRAGSSRVEIRDEKGEVVAERK